ncbi:hypothetical protein [Streptomyces sp. RP5T]|uniref:hypothetical protein n=1 Tax=Streptomyces sp. RP5T TaxID=2490848 RepID=UPI000F64F578|nr:hypothetical protein [Streptomyces sp. RP5T]RRR76338.1 hypothetical protein EHS43_30915 [Streptomyces sp. RP5T]
MHPRSRSAGTRGALAAILLLSSVFLGACSALGGDGCQDTGAELGRLAEQPLLASVPAGASAPANYRGVGVTTGCDDDSGGAPWLHADRLYVFPGRADDVIGHYARAAAAAGWRLEEDPAPGAPPATVEGACWSRTEQGRHLLFQVDLRPQGFSPEPEPEPEVGTALTYAVSVGTERGGGEETCWH